LPRRFRRCRLVLLAAIVVSLSIGIVFASVPILPHPHSSIQQSEIHYISGAGNGPGVYALTVQINSGESFAVKVTVTNGTATFCVIDQQDYVNWSLNSQFSPGYPFPFSKRILQEVIAQDT
jgi:hypothetical protein